MKTKYHPILFSTPMVQGIDENRKTQTRRTKGLEEINKNSDEWILNDWFASDGICFLKKSSEEVFFPKCPYNVGDVLWVKETSKVGAWNDEEYKVAFDYKASPELTKTPWCEYNDIEKFDILHEKLLNQLDKLGVEPRVDEENERIYYKWEPGKSPFKWTPSIFMLKEAARFFLKIKSIRIERLQDITEVDAIAEGVEKIADYGSTGYKLYTEPEAAYSDIDAIYSFESLWFSINGEDSWNNNPFVWVYEFEKIDKPEDFKF